MHMFILTVTRYSTAPGGYIPLQCAILHGQIPSLRPLLVAIFFGSYPYCSIGCWLGTAAAVAAGRALGKWGPAASVVSRRSHHDRRERPPVLSLVETEESRTLSCQNGNPDNIIANQSLP